jgi:small GTP-binding protein
MGINDLFNSNRNSENDNNQIQSSSDIAINNSDNKKELNNKEDLLSSKEFKQYYIISLANLINKNVILLGDSKIGKTKLFNLIIGNNENNNNEINSEQNYAYFEEKLIKMNGFEININIWDTPGGEKHREANKHFIKDCIISYLCFHFKMKKSFENIVNYYMNLVKEINGKNTFIVLLGIKNKIFEDEDEEDGNNISINLIKNFAEKNNILYYIVSLEDNNTVNYFFYDSIKQYSLYKAMLNFKNK